MERKQMMYIHKLLSDKVGVIVECDTPMIFRDAIIFSVFAPLFDRYNVIVNFFLFLERDWKFE